MIHEFALEPTCLDNWQDFRYFFDLFGIPHGRLISQFPKRWKMMVYDAAAHCGDIEKARIEERLRTIDEKLLRIHRPYDGTKDWLTNAEVAHVQVPFHAVISKGNPRNHDFVLRRDEIDDSTPQWNVPRSRPIARNAAEMAQRVTVLFSKSSEIVFVDPNFGPEKARYRRTLQEFLSIAASACPTIKRLEFHLEAKSTNEFFCQTCDEQLPRLIPIGMTMRFIRWRQLDTGDQLHARYVLTDAGGIHFESGLDDGDTGETTDVNLLDKDLYLTRFRQYRKHDRDEDNAFQFVDEHTVVGLRT